MKKLSKCLLLAFLAGTFTIQVQTLMAQEKEREVIIIEEVTDAKGNKTVKKIVKKGGDISDSELEKLLKVTEGTDGNLEVIIDEDELSGDDIIIIKEIETEYDNEPFAFAWSQKEIDPKPTIGVMLEFGSGAVITRVVEDSGAEIAGLEPGDVIKSINGEEIVNYENVKSALAENEIGDKVEVVIARGEDTQTHSIELKNNNFNRLTYENVEKEYADKYKMKKKKKTDKPRLGVMIEDNEGVISVTEVIEDSAAAKAGLQSGDVINNVNGTDITSYEDLIKVIKEADEELNIEYERAGKLAMVKAQLKPKS